MLIMFYRIHIMHRDVERFCNFPLRQVLLHPGSTEHLAGRRRTDFLSGATGKRLFWGSF